MVSILDCFTEDDLLNFRERSDGNLQGACIGECASESGKRYECIIDLQRNVVFCISTGKSHAPLDVLKIKSGKRGCSDE